MSKTFLTSQELISDLIDPDKAYETLTFTRSDDDVFISRENSAHTVFKTEVTDNVTYAVKISDTSGLGDTFRLSDLVDKEIDCLLVNILATAPGKFNQPAGTQFGYGIYRAIPGDKIHEEFKTALTKAKQVRDNSIAQLSKIESIEFPLVMLGVMEKRGCTFVGMLALDEREKLNPTWTGKSEGPRITLDDHGKLEEFLIEEKLLAYSKAYKFIRQKIRELLDEMSEFNDRMGYVFVPESIKKHAFWDEAEKLLKSFDPDHEKWIVIPAYQYDALVAKFGK